MIKLAPICLFTYNRLEETKKTLAALQQNNLAKESELFVFSDGWKNKEGKEKIIAVRKLLKEIKGFKKVTVFESETNKGLANSIINGVTQIVEQYGKVIVLEDDLITSSNFLDFMNQALEYYKNNKKIISISGHTLDFEKPKDYEYDNYFFGRAGSWGWATWAPKWTLIDWDIKDWDDFKRDKKQVRKFKENGSDLFLMLNDFKKGLNNSWAIRFCYNQFKLNLLTVYPCVSKVNNIGFSDDATNCVGYNKYKILFKKEDFINFNFKKEVYINNRIVKQIRKYFSFITGVKSKILTIYYDFINND